MKQKLIAITGGIGSGKSVISKILKILGYNIYDCDTNAKILMDNSPEIKKELFCNISPTVIKPNGDIDRVELANIVFNNKTLLERLNSIVHSAVKKDIQRWTIQHKSQTPLFIETAILYQSGLNRIVNEVWDIYAPQDIRIKRVMSRNNFTVEQVLSRIKSQQIHIANPHKNTIHITNDNFTMLLPQILQLIN